MKTIKAICDNIDGLQKISGERIWTELKKTLQGNYRLELFTKLIECGAGRYIGIYFLFARQNNYIFILMFYNFEI